jgi:hypothetical protein
MGYFARPRSFLSKNYHSYITDDPVLQNIGLASYTRNTLENFGMEQRDGQKRLNNDVSEYFGGSVPKTALTGDNATLSCMFYDREFKRYLLKTGNELWETPSGIAATSLTQFQERFDLLQKGFESAIGGDSTVAAVKLAWANIQTSLSGCITFDATYTFIDESNTSKIRLYFQSGSKAKSDREVAQKGSMVIAGVPSTAYGMEYAGPASAETSIGTYIPPLVGGNNNPENTVAGEVRKSYNPSLGKWEFGTQQIIAKLLTDVDGIPEVTLPDDLSNSEFFSVSSPVYLGRSEKGLAMPLSAENGNPDMFGPDIVGCAKRKLSKIVVVNRSPRQFRKGELVLCSLIGPDWIMMPFEPGNSAPKRLEVSWSDIQKYIIDAASFFKDQGGSDMTADQYITHTRWRFYESLTQGGSVIPDDQLAICGGASRLQALNLNGLSPDSYEVSTDGEIIIPPFGLGSSPEYYQTFRKPSRGGFQAFDADVLGNKVGGNRNESALILTNISKVSESLDQGGGVRAYQVPNSWGMYFRDGYTSSSVSKLKKLSGESYAVQNQYYGIYPEDGGTFDFSNPVLPSVETFFDLSDSFMYHLPAQIALNGRSNQTKLIKIYDDYRFTNGNFSSNMKFYLSAFGKGSWITNSTGKDAFALTPVNKRAVQFTSLSFNLALCGTELPIQERIPFTYTFLRDELLSTHKRSSLLIGGVPGFGLQSPRIFRNPQSQDLSIRTFVGFGNECIKFNDQGEFQEFIKPDIRRPDGVLQILPETDGKNGANRFFNVVGVIAAKAVVDLSTGGQLQFDTDNHFGLVSFTNNTVGSSNILVSTISNITSDLSGRSTSSRIVNYGSSDDQERSFGTTALYCKVYDHCPDVIYDGRFFVPLQFNGSGDALGINMPTSSGGGFILPVDALINQGSYPKAVNSDKKLFIRKNMLLTGGGFTYIKRVIGADPLRIEIVNSGVGYSDGDTFSFGNAKFRVSETTEQGGIKAYEVVSYGDFSNNPFVPSPHYLVNSTIVDAEGTPSDGVEAEIRLHGAKVIEQIGYDPAPTDYGGGPVLLSRPDNGGEGDNQQGEVNSIETKSINLDKNSSGKYDVFFFYANDIGMYPETNAGSYISLQANPYAQYINLEMSVS